MPVYPRRRATAGCARKNSSVNSCDLVRRNNAVTFWQHASACLPRAKNSSATASRLAEVPRAEFLEASAVEGLAARRCVAAQLLAVGQVLPGDLDS